MNADGPVAQLNKKLNSAEMELVCALGNIQASLDPYFTNKMMNDYVHRLLIDSLKEIWKIRKDAKVEGYGEHAAFL